MQINLSRLWPVGSSVPAEVGWNEVLLLLPGGITIIHNTTWGLSVVVFCGHMLPHPIGVNCDGGSDIAGWNPELMSVISLRLATSIQETKGIRESTENNHELLNKNLFLTFLALYIKYLILVLNGDILILWLFKRFKWSYFVHCWREDWVS